MEGTFYGKSRWVNCALLQSIIILSSLSLNPIKPVYFVIVRSILVLAKAVVSFSSTIIHTSPLSKRKKKQTNLVSSPISGVHTVTDLKKKKKGCTHMQMVMFSDRFIKNKNEGSKVN